MAQERRVAVVTGGSSGIGLATATALAARGFTLVLAARNAERGAAAVTAIQAEGGDALYHQTDVQREVEMAALFAMVRARFGRLDLLVNNAGTAEPGFFDNLSFTEEQIDQQLATNVKGTFMGYKHALPLLLEEGGGMVINTTTILGSLLLVPPLLFYGVTKAAIISMTRSFAKLYADQGLRTYAVCPTTTDTPMLGTGMPALTPEVRAAFAQGNPSGTLVDPAEVAALIVALAEGESAYANGDAIMVDHGLVAKVELPAFYG